MALSYSEIIAEALLNLSETKRLQSITVQDILAYTGISRQTFYNHFRDKNDLIAYIYDTRIIPEFTEDDSLEDYRQSLTASLKNMKTYASFLQQACRKEDTGCLKEHMLQHCIDFDLKWHQKCYGKKRMPEELVFATKYHAIASNTMVLSWILSGMPSPIEEMVTMITEMRSLGMEVLFQDADGTGNPYRK